MKRLRIIDIIAAGLPIISLVLSIYWLSISWDWPAAVALAQSIVALLTQIKWTRWLNIIVVVLVILSARWVISKAEAEPLIALVSSGSTILGLSLSLRRVESKPLLVDGPLLNELAETMTNILIRGRLRSEFTDNEYISIDAVSETIVIFKEKVLLTSEESVTGSAVDMIYQLFIERRRLLVLGRQASGKTITLLQVLQKLLELRNNAPLVPVPVLLNLSSWSQERKILSDWMVDELDRSYGLDKAIGRSVVSGNYIIPLLDGLDEVEANIRDECIDRINEYCISTLDDKRIRVAKDIIIGCRDEVFESIKNFEFLFVTKENLLTGEIKKVYHNAIRLLPLNQNQIDEYLERRDADIQSIESARRDSSAINTLIHSPFFLKVIASVYTRGNVINSAPRETIENTQVSLLDAYIDEIFNLVNKNKKLVKGAHSKDHTVYYLSNIANYLECTGQSQLYVDRLQPSLLRKFDWLTYAVLSFFISGFVGAIVGSIGVGTFLYYFSVEYPNNIYGALVGALAIATVAGLYGGTSIGILSFLACIILTAITHQFYPQSSLTIGNIATGSVIGFVAAINKQLGYFIPSNVSLARAAIRLFLGFFAGLIFITILALAYAISADLIGNITILFLFSLAMGLIIGYIFRFVVVRLLAMSRLAYKAENKAEIIPRESLTWSSTGATANFAFPFAIGLLVSAIVPSLKLSFITLLALTVAMLGGFQSKGRRPDKRPLIKPNYAIFTSAKSAGKVIVAGCIMGMVATILFSNIIAGFLYTVALAGASFIAYGGFALWQHYILRLVFHLDKYMPFRLVEFLEYTSTIMLTRRVGAGYVFSHSILQKYFARKRS